MWLKSLAVEMIQRRPKTYETKGHHCQEKIKEPNANGETTTKAEYF